MLETYLSNGQNATQAYLKHHPKSKYTSAEVSAHRWLRKPKVQAELTRRLSAEHGITRASIESDLLWCAEQAKVAGDYEALASIRMDCAKLAGFLVEKREVKTVTDTDQSSLSDLVRSTLRMRSATVQQTHSATASLPSPVADAPTAPSAATESVAGVVSAFNAESQQAASG